MKSFYAGFFYTLIYLDLVLNAGLKNQNVNMLCGNSFYITKYIMVMSRSKGEKNPNNT